MHNTCGHVGISHEFLLLVPCSLVCKSPRLQKGHDLDVFQQANIIIGTFECGTSRFALLVYTGACMLDHLQLVMRISSSSHYYLSVVKISSQ